MSLSDTIKNDMKAAMRARDKARLGVIRLILAAIKQREVDERITLDDGQVLGVLEKMVKQRRDSVQQYRQGGREDLATQEESEIEVISAYLPEKFSDAEVAQLIDRIVSETGAAGVKDMGKVMARLKSEAAGRIDMASASSAVRQRLAG